MEKQRDVRFSQRLDLFPLDLGQLRIVAGVDLYIALFSRHGERLVQDSSNILDRLGA